MQSHVYSLSCGNTFSKHRVRGLWDDLVRPAHRREADPERASELLTQAIPEGGTSGVAPQVTSDLPTDGPACCSLCLCLLPPRWPPCLPWSA